MITCSIVFDSNAFGGLDINNFALHWTMTCANDVIEGGSSGARTGNDAALWHGLDRFGGKCPPSEKKIRNKKI